jgi:hypothetical protein
MMSHVGYDSDEPDAPHNLELDTDSDEVRGSANRHGMVLNALLQELTGARAKTPFDSRRPLAIFVKPEPVLSDSPWQSAERIGHSEAHFESSPPREDTYSLHISSQSRLLQQGALQCNGADEIPCASELSQDGTHNRFDDEDSGRCFPVISHCATNFLLLTSDYVDEKTSAESFQRGRSSSSEDEVSQGMIDLSESSLKILHPVSEEELMEWRARVQMAYTHNYVQDLERVLIDTKNVPYLVEVRKVSL